MFNAQTHISFPFTTVGSEQWDSEWAKDWRKITAIFATIDQLESQFEELEVSVLRELSQKKLIIDLKKYAYSLSKIIEHKYS